MRIVVVVKDCLVWCESFVMVSALSPLPADGKAESAGSVLLVGPNSVFATELN